MSKQINRIADALMVLQNVSAMFEKTADQRSCQILSIEEMQSLHECAQLVRQIRDLQIYKARNFKLASFSELCAAFDLTAPRISQIYSAVKNSRKT